MNKPTIELITTTDGSHSLYVRDLDEHYHSVHGAIQEAIHVFINAGLKHIASSQNRKEISILEIGFGTGLNTLLTLVEANQLHLSINYTSLEAFPLAIDIINKLNYTELINQKGNLDSIFTEIHTCEWNKEVAISEHFTLHKINNTLEEVQLQNKFDLIYFDAFGPRVQPEMWTEELFLKIFNGMNPNGCLVTYCAKGEVKRTLKKVGFTVETLPGPPMKREMIRGTKNGAV